MRSRGWVGIVAAASLALAMPGWTPAAAQEPGEGKKEKEIRLEEVKVTATRLRDSLVEVTRIPAHVTVITAEEIQRSGARTVQEALQQVPGVIVYDQVGNPFESVIDFRGFNGQPTTGTTVLVDGVRVNEPEFNTLNLDLVPLEHVERIEVIPGTASIFGKNALAGVVNIVTRRGREVPETVVEAAAGSEGRQRYSLTTSGPLKAFDYYVGVTRELSDSFRDEDFGRISRGLAKVGYRAGDDTDISLSYSRTVDRLKQAGSLPLPILAVDRGTNLIPGTFFDKRLDLVTLNFRQRLAEGLSLALNGFVRNATLDSLINNPGFISQVITDTTSPGGTAQLTHRSTILGRGNQATLGLEFTRNAFESRGTFPGRRETTEDVVGLYAEDQYEVLPDLTLSGGMRYDRDHVDFQSTGNPADSRVLTFDRPNPKAGLTYKFAEGSSAYASFSEGFRTPSVDEMFVFFPGLGFTSNPQLRPVRSRTYELGGRVQPFAWLEGSLALFRTQTRDEIFFVPAPPFGGTNQNIGKTLRQGVEFAVKGRYLDLLRTYASYTYTRATFESRELVQQVLPVLVTPGDRLPLVPQHRLAAGASLQRGGFTLSLDGLYVTNQFILGDEANTLSRIAPYFVLNAKASYRLKDVTFFVQGNNLFDQRYNTSGILGFPPPTFAAQPVFVPAPGISIFGGVSIRFTGYY